MNTGEKANRLKMRLYGFPEYFYGVGFEDTAIKAPEAERLKNAFSTVRKGSVCYVSGNVAPIVNLYYNSGVKIRGVDASVYIDDPFDKEEKVGLPQAEVVVIYNCVEGTTMLPLVHKVLKKLVANYKNSMVILQGEALPRAFNKDFLQVQNSCVITNAKEESWL